MPAYDVFSGDMFVTDVTISLLYMWSVPYVSSLTTWHMLLIADCHVG